MKKIDKIKIGEHTIGLNTSPFIIAELSGNHNGKLSRAIELIDAAIDSGAHAIKLQTYTADTITLNSNRPEFRISEGPWKGRSLYDLYSEASTPWEWHEELFAHAKKNRIECFSSPFDKTAVDFLSKLCTPAFKIASFELVDLPLIANAATKGVPLIMSTGVADLDEIAEACKTVEKSGAAGYALLHCISEYPAKPKQMRLSSIKKLKRKFKVPIGLSDHTLGTTMAVAAVSLGATIIEKHITLKRSDGGPDSGFSSEPKEFKKLVKDCQDAYDAVSRSYDLSLGIDKANAAFRRSIFVVRPIKAGKALTKKNIRSIRPGTGIPPKYLETLIGKKAKVDMKKGEPLHWDKIII